MKLVKYLFLLLPLIVMTSCDKEPEEEEESTLPTASYYFQADIDDETVTFEQNVDGFYSGMLGDGAFDIDQNVQAGNGSLMTMVNITSEGLQPAPYFSVYFYKTFPGQYEASIEDIISIYEVGSYVYAETIEESFETTDGVEIIYSSDGEKYWSTSIGSQSGATFELTEYIDNPSSESLKIISAEFDCTLFDEDGNSMELKKGIYRGLAVTF